MIIETIADVDFAYVNDPGWAGAVAIEEGIGERQATRRISEWPTSGTLKEYQDAIASAALEADFVLRVWARWAKQGQPLPEGRRLELGSARLHSRYETAKEICWNRSARFQWLNEPAGHA